MMPNYVQTLSVLIGLLEKACRVRDLAQIESIQTTITRGPAFYMTGLPAMIAKVQSRHDATAKLWETCRKRREYDACASLSQSVSLYANMAQALSECLDAGELQPEYLTKREELITAGIINPAS